MSWCVRKGEEEWCSHMKIEPLGFSFVAWAQKNDGRGSIGVQ